jgi:phosphatidylserine/phosphatidylglycerophosphate/cardiolipin synthase-like enzyme
MSPLLSGLGPPQLEALADALERGRLAILSLSSLAPLVGDQANSGALEELEERRRKVGDSVLAGVLRGVAAERRAATLEADRRLELVWTGPERAGAGTRDTAVVVRELFQQAERDVLVSGYAVFGGRAIFTPLTERKRERPSLRVRLFLNIQRREHDIRPEHEIVAEFGRRFLENDWPQAQPPEVYYDPRGLGSQPEQRGVLHAKCVVVDDRRALVTSANLTEAAQSRNIEAGVLLEDPGFSTGLRLQFDTLVEAGGLQRVRW